MMKEHYIKQLEELKSKLFAHKMSVLVGAGFSKNVDKNKFLSWDELLKDIVSFLYEDEIEYKYATLKRKNNKDEFVKQQIQRIIDREGYLEIVSQYVKRKGFREAIEIYIENHTPHLRTDGKDIFIEGFFDDKPYKDKLCKNDLNLHKRLLDLSWNNIYTTNYDNLLESVVDDTIESHIKAQIKTIEEKVNASKEEIEKNKTALIKLDEELSEIEAKLFLLLEDEKIQRSVNEVDKNDLEDKKQKKESEKRKIDFRIFDIQRNITINETEKFNLEKELSQCITIITHSSDLQIKRNKNIIKLHGSLRNENSEFGFDGDNHCHYVIAKEDYDAYPTRHEAFTQLMRISLLQESYCLIGFSGVDPNFTSWISWVRDIIKRKHAHEKDNYKIYLIEVLPENNTEIERTEKQLFFENHRIIKIPIWKKEIVDFLKRQNEIQDIDDKNPKELLKLLFQYLSNEECLYKPKAYIELADQKKYNAGWENITNGEYGKKIKLSPGNKYNDIGKYKHKVRVPSLDWFNFHDKQTFLFFIDALLKKSSPKEQKIILNLLPIAIRDSFLTPHFIWENGLEAIMPYVKIKRQKIELSQFRLIEAVLFVDKDKFNTEVVFLSKEKLEQDIVKYQSVLFSAFTFDFVAMKKQIDEWEPNNSSRWYVKKLGLLSLFDAKESETQLKEYCNTFDYLSFQEQLYALETLNYVSRNNYIMKSGKDEIKEKIEQYKNLGFKSFMDNFDYLMEELNKEQTKTKILPYGEGRFSENNTINFANGTTRPQHSMQFIQLMMEFGIPLSLRGMHLKDAVTWFNVFNPIFEYTPYPAIFYSLQITDEKTLRRIAQECAYSDNIKNNIPDILEKLLIAYLQNETPNLYKDNILVFSSELFIAVSPERWQSYFYEIWQLFEKQNQLFYDGLRHRNTGLYSFITKGLKYITDVKIIRKVLLSIIDNFNIDHDTAIEYLYYFADNDTKHKFGRKICNKQIDGKINVLIEQISQENESVIFALGNLHSHLSQVQKENIEKFIENIDFQSIKNERVWRILLFFAKNEILRSRIKRGIIENKKLWYTGINTNGSISGEEDFIDLHLLDTKYAKESGIEWSNAECVELYNKLKENFEKIQHCRIQADPIFSFKRILEEMDMFLDNEASKLKSESDFQSIKQEVRKLYYEKRGYETITSALISDDHSKIITALSELFYDIYYRVGIEKNKEALNLLMNKVLMKKTPALEACLGYLSNLLKSRKNEKLLRSFSSVLNLILNEYNIEEDEIEKPFLHQNMIRIAEVLEYWGFQNDGIDKWLKIKSEKQFNFVSTI
ncbi:hypothetical protein AGMMS50262_00360 [Bacteroidia bacterium]|nr:hypothetical protein AGMMS50262_00360 [Bacteroidia bacterium]